LTYAQFNPPPSICVTAAAAAVHIIQESKRLQEKWFRSGIVVQLKPLTIPGVQ
jgi:hypothetical protein